MSMFMSRQRQEHGLAVNPSNTGRFHTIYAMLEEKISTVLSFSDYLERPIQACLDKLSRFLSKPIK